MGRVIQSGTPCTHAAVGGALLGLLCVGCELIGAIDDRRLPARNTGGAGGELGCGQLASDASDVWVDAAAEVGGPGTAECPLRSISDGVAALAYPARPGLKTLHVAAGLYDAEPLPIVLDRGIVIEGAGQGVTVVRGVGDWDPGPVGGNGGGAHPVTFAVNARDESVVIRGLSILPPAEQVHSVAVMCIAGNAPQDDPLVEPFPEANLVLDNVAIPPGHEANVWIVNTSDSGCNAKIVGSFIDGGEHVGVLAYGCGFDHSMGPRVALQLGDGTEAGRNEIAGSYAAIASWGCVEHLRIEGNDITGKVGIHIDEYTTYADPSLGPVIAGNWIHGGTEAGILLSDLDTITVTLTDNVIERFRGKIGFPPATGVTSLGARLYARGNSITGNDIGVRISQDAALKAELDFGTDANPGLNVIRCNSVDSAQQGAGFDLGFEGPYLTDDLVHFAGNTWDHAAPTMVDASDWPNGTDIARPAAIPAIHAAGAVSGSGACPAGYVP